VTACGQFLLWAAYGDKECKPSHEDQKLTMTQVLQVKDMLMESSKKILEKNKQS